MNNLQSIKQNLQVLGLDSFETTVYLSLLEHGSQTHLQLSRNSGVNRSKVYRCLERLKEKKLVEETGLSWGTRIQAADLTNLELLIKDQEAEITKKKEVLENVMVELKSLVRITAPGFTFKNYRGVSGLKQMLWDQLSAKKEILQFAYQTRNEIAGKQFAEKIREEQVKRKIKLYEIENATDQGKFWYTSNPEFSKFYDSRHVPDKILLIRQNISVFDNTVSIMNWEEGDKSGVEIVNSSFAKTISEMFWHFWDITEHGKVRKQFKK